MNQTQPYPDNAAVAEYFATPPGPDDAHDCGCPDCSTLTFFRVATNLGDGQVILTSCYQPSMEETLLKVHDAFQMTEGEFQVELTTDKERSFGVAKFYDWDSGDLYGWYMVSDPSKV